MPHRLIQGAHHRRSRNRRFQGRHRGPSFRHLIQRQISNDEELASAKSPLLLWGSSLWSEGEKGRKIDGLKYLKEDFAGDGVHPSGSGREKVAKQLLEFFATSPLAKGWFAN
ncbi:MAG TPA: hypothetical protein PLB55_00760 [Prosthecobacter sp.]|nr:hypothetical protein [Prosthecobacter sp.]